MEIIFSHEKVTAILIIDKNTINLGTPSHTANQLGLIVKDEFHITIIGSETGKEILKSLLSLSDQERNEKINKIHELCESFNWEVALNDEFYYIQKKYNNPDPSNSEMEVMEERESIIQLAQITDLEEFYQKLNAFLNKQFEIPLPHVTLFTKSTRDDKMLRGIGIYSSTQFKELKPKKIF